MRKTGSARGGFTLIELLVVIAIIAILAALLFPAFNHVRESTRQSTCMQELSALQQAVKLYHEDNNKYPTVLYGYAEQPGGALYTGTGQPVPIDAVKNRPLFISQKYIKDRGQFHCPDDLVNDPLAVTTAVYPQGVPLAGQPVLVQGNPAYFYKNDSYDTGPRVEATGKTPMPIVTEVHYSRDWTGTTGGGDAPNQLKYPDPPADRTLITWCTYHVATAHTDVVTVLMLSGTAKATQVNKFVPLGPLNFKF